MLLLAIITASYHYVKFSWSIISIISSCPKFFRFSCQEDKITVLVIWPSYNLLYYRIRFRASKRGNSAWKLIPAQCPRLSIPKDQYLITAHHLPPIFALCNFQSRVGPVPFNRALSILVLPGGSLRHKSTARSQGRTLSHLIKSSRHLALKFWSAWNI